MDTPNAGHVQVKYNGTWGTICAKRRNLAYQSAEVICRQLGQGRPAKHSFMNKECTAKNLGAERVWLANLNCRGFEDSIDQCPHRGWGRMDSEYCRSCTPQHCSVCLICQPREANITGTMNVSFFLFVCFCFCCYWVFLLLLLLLLGCFCFFSFVFFLGFCTCDCDAYVWGFKNKIELNNIEKH